MKPIKKMIMKKSARLTLLSAAIAVLVLGVYGTVRALTPSVISESTALYSYTMSAGGTYEVRLIENELFPEGILGEDRIYAGSLIDRLNITFSADYSGDQAANLKGEYSIIVTVSGFQGSGDTRKIVYARQYPLVAKAITGETTANITDTVSLNLNTYREFAEEADLILNSRLGREAVVTFQGIFLAETDYGNVNEPFSYSLQIPLTGDLFSIAKGTPISRSDSIVTTHEVVVSPAQNSAVVPLLGVFLGIATLLAYALVTRPPTMAEQAALDFRSIKRKHGSRIVNLHSLPPVADSLQAMVADLESLIRISDERQQPICCALNAEGLPEEGLLFVADDKRYYMLYLNQ